jgi:uncharacterized membrane protein
VWIAAFALGLLLFWLVLTRFESGQINAVDFTVYFDRPAFQTLHGKPLFVETAEATGNSYRSALALHAYWVMFPLTLLYTVAATPMWLLAISVIAVVAGAVHILRICLRLGASGPLAAAAAIAFAVNANTARALNYGFHPEILYAWFIPWLLDSGLRRRPFSFLLAVVACVSVKEDAIMALTAVAFALWLHGRREFKTSQVFIFVLSPVLIGAINLWLFYRVVVPALNVGGTPTYSALWSNYGPTPLAAVLGMLQRPWSVIARSLRSGFFTTVLVPFLYLPIIGWRWTIGIVPIVLIYGASVHEPLRGFGLYYSVITLAFLTVGTATGVQFLAQRLFGRNSPAELVGAAIVLTASLLVGNTTAGYSLIPWKNEVRSVPAALVRLASERTVLVQSGLYPHAGYEARTKLLTADTLRDPANRGAAVLLAPRVSAYPLTSEALRPIYLLPDVGPVPTGLRAVRLTVASAEPGRH